jgi:hypothetical protein
LYLRLPETRSAKRLRMWTRLQMRFRVPVSTRRDLHAHLLLRSLMQNPRVISGSNAKE